MSTDQRATRHSLTVIYATVALDAAGIGVVFPILPRLIQDVTHTGDVAACVGWLASLYAAMQFVFAPVLGALSDRLGRRPILLVSLAGTAANYVIMGFAFEFWMLLLGRAVAGLTSANVSVATAYLTDITPEELRPRRFGMMSAMFGAGFIVGPVLGGVLGEYWVRLPFIAAAILNAANLLLAFVTLPESHPRSTAPFDPRALNPLAPLRWLFSMPRLLPLVLVYFALSGAGEAYGVCWALWGYDAFRWNGFWIGLSLGAFGVWQTLVQAVLPGRATKRLGERKAILTGLACSCVALAGLALASRGWMVFLIMPVFALGSIGTPALQALATRAVDNDRQGQLQGLLASTVSLASIIAPLGFTAFYFTVHRQWPGAIWLAVAAINLAAMPLVLLGTSRRRKALDNS
ncbi:TCR/Tet family MFS transporter [Gluconobacter frateurii]|uniref:Major facilitator superfamily transporter n=1 Tax=Gluconobacter frateurii NRIC 0228 TaxID=1307946 RepID=A0ABQ0Q941_9PROT|nr:TCR/Tet family MFS transporter [Gluconobacter frateurii]GBR09594.1 major facilitator superfamily transporter [Gluconobacter frateurii NRIC 0228]GLP91908.1 tetracycline efflux MFS transporter Tet(30) [Gluconobacter frateurii]